MDSMPSHASPNCCNNYFKVCLPVGLHNTIIVELVIFVILRQVLLALACPISLRSLQHLGNSTHLLLSSLGAPFHSNRLLMLLLQLHKYLMSSSCCTCHRVPSLALSKVCPTLLLQKHSSYPTTPNRATAATQFKHSL